MGCKCTFMNVCDTFLKKTKQIDFKAESLTFLDLASICIKQRDLSKVIHEWPFFKGGGDR